MLLETFKKIVIKYKKIIFSIFPVNWHGFIGQTGIFVCFTVIFYTSYCFAYDFVLSFYAHKEELADMIFEIEVNWIVQEKFKEITISSFKDTFNVFKLQFFYGFDAKSAINIYKYHMLKEIPFGDPIIFNDTFPIELDMTEKFAEKRAYEINQIEKIVTILIFSSLIFAGVVWSTK